LHNHKEPAAKGIGMIFFCTNKFRELLCIAQVFLFYATGALSQSDDTILARVADKDLTVREFKLRTELTIRPNNFKDKNAAVNNLVSEKILSIEAMKTSMLPSNQIFQATLKGIKEQAMRDKLYEVAAVQKVKIDSNEMKTAYRLSQREYDVEFYSLHDQALAGRVTDIMDTSPELSGELFSELQEIAGQKPLRKVKFKDRDVDAIRDALFTALLDTGAVIGPLNTGTGSYIVMRVVNWTDYPIISGQDQIERWAEVKEFLRESKARKAWAAFQADMMKGKKIEFSKEPFNVLCDMAFTRYALKKKSDSLHVTMGELPFPAENVDLGTAFFSLDGKTWTIGEFREKLLSHPLVFRTTAIDSTNFRREFKLAIVDMMRDYYLTQESYKRALDTTDDVAQTVVMWKDAMLAQDEQKRVVESALKDGKIKADDREGVRHYWISYIQDLQRKYSSKIVIDQATLAKIRLTNVDMFAFRPGVPYPVAVPDFPLYISTQKLDALMH
jgi:hypothetical protein